jgi:FKBP-type peptidyl-prolyl cis-trans isomerase
MGNSHASAKIVVPPPVSKRNLRRSLQEGDRRREELELARGPVRETASGIQYREMEVGFGKEVQREDTCDVAYEVFTQGGLYLDSVGVGMESKKDIGETVRITLDASVPIAIRDAMRGMREGGKRRIVVPPNLGWVTRDLQPPPSSSAAARRFWRYAEDNTPMLFEVELVRCSRRRTSRRLGMNQSKIG